MADAANAAPGAGAGGWGLGFLDKAFQFVLIYFIISGVLKPQTAPPSQQTPAAPIDASSEATVAAPVYKDSNPLMSLIGAESPRIPVFPTHDSLGRPLPPHSCIYSKDTRFNLDVYLSPKETLDSHDRELSPIFHHENIPFDWHKDTTTVSELLVNISLSESIKRNESSLYAHVYFTIAHSSIHLPPFHPDYDPFFVFSKHVPLVVYKKRPKKKNTKLLLEKNDFNDSVVADEVISEDTTYLPYWKPSLVLSLVLGLPDRFPRNAIPPSVIQHLDFVNNNGTHFYPLVYHDDFWVLSKHLIIINDTLSTVPLHIKYAHIPFWKWSIQMNMDAQNKANMQLGASSDHENDAMKEIFTDTNPWLLGVTVVVSLLHMVFDMLAFKNDIHFWRKVELFDYALYDRYLLQKNNLEKDHVGHLNAFSRSELLLSDHHFALSLRQRYLYDGSFLIDHRTSNRVLETGQGV